MKNRIGKFYVPTRSLYKQQEDVMAIMGQCIIMRAESLGYADRMEYFAICEQFDEVEDGLLAPEYIWEIRGGEPVARKA